MARLFRKPAFWIVSVLVVSCLYFAVINLLEVRTRTNVIMMVQNQALDKPHIRTWLQEQKARGPFELEGWDILKEKGQGTYIVSFTISREDPQRQSPPIHEGFWFRVDPRDASCQAIPCPE